MAADPKTVKFRPLKDRNRDRSGGVCVEDDREGGSCIEEPVKRGAINEDFDGGKIAGGLEGDSDFGAGAEF